MDLTHKKVTSNKEFRMQSRESLKEKWFSAIWHFLLIAVFSMIIKFIITYFFTELLLAFDANEYMWILAILVAIALLIASIILENFSLFAYYERRKTNFFKGVLRA